MLKGLADKDMDIFALARNKKRRQGSQGSKIWDAMDSIVPL